MVLQLPTVEDFKKHDWQDSISLVEKRKTSQYYTVFSRNAGLAEKAGDATGCRIYELLARVTVAALKTGSRDEPFSLCLLLEGCSCTVPEPT
jgi:hypothetical protein